MAKSEAKPVRVGRVDYLESAETSKRTRRQLPCGISRGGKVSESVDVVLRELFEKMRRVRVGLVWLSFKEGIRIG